jgi:hypothetical protein
VSQCELSSSTPCSSARRRLAVTDSRVQQKPSNADWLGTVGTRGLLQKSIEVWGLAGGYLQIGATSLHVF